MHFVMFMFRVDLKASKKLKKFMSGTKEKEKVWDWSNMAQIIL